MALSKEIIHKGIPFTYWVLGAKEYDKNKNITRYSIRGYMNREVREENIENYIPDFSKIYESAGDLTTAECYEEAKKSVLVKNILKVAEEAKIRVIQDENGQDVEQIVEPAKEEEFEMIEINPLVGAITIQP